MGRKKRKVQRWRLILPKGGKLIAEPVDYIQVKTMAVRNGADVWIGAVRPVSAGRVKVKTELGTAYFDLADVELLRILGTEEEVRANKALEALAETEALSATQ